MSVRSGTAPWGSNAPWTTLGYSPDADWVALDFETATSARASACALGLVYVKDGRIVHLERTLIRPPGNDYDGRNIGIHGIHPEMTAMSLTFSELWPIIQERIAGKALVAHNASFDMSVLRHELDRMGRAYPETEYYCTLVMSRACWSGLCSHRLPDVASHCGLTFCHHDPGEDAKACAEILLQMGGGSHPTEVAAQHGVRAGHLYRGGYSSCGRL